MKLLPHQQTPPGHWRVWKMLGDRAIGKTLGGALATHRERGGGDVALLGPSRSHVLRNMLRGPSGLVENCPEGDAISIVRETEFRWLNGGRGICLSDSQNSLDQLRGGDLTWIWWDEPYINHPYSQDRVIADLLPHLKARILITSSGCHPVAITTATIDDNPHLSPDVREAIQKGPRG